MSSAAVAQPRLLLVEDDPEIPHIVRDTLEEEGCIVTPTPSLPASLALLSEQSFHLVLTDLFQSSGQEPLQSIHLLLAEAVPTPVGIMTAWPVPVDAAAQAGIAFLLRKPFELDDLVRSVQRELTPSPGHERQSYLVEQFFAALGERNWKRLGLLCLPDLVIVPLSAPPLVDADSRRGLLSLRAALEQRFRLLPGYTFEDVRVNGRPLGVAARYTTRWQSRDGIIHHLVGSMHFRFQDDRIAQIAGGF
jgi:CheY-like chemotaxis protein